MIVGVCPALEPSLLGKQVGRRRLGGFRFQIPMHAFVRTVVLGMPRTGKLNGDPLLNPPDTQPGEAP